MGSCPPQVAAGRDVPWHVHQAAEVAEERAWLWLRAALQVAAPAESLEGGHAHALAVDRVEAGDRVAHHQQAVREAVQLFVAMPDAGWEARKATGSSSGSASRTAS
jgi:hypothetical protein